MKKQDPISDKTAEESSAWGSLSAFYDELTPNKILDVCEQSLQCHTTGRVQALNSLENRVYDIELESDESPMQNGSTHVIFKFYRPMRWSKEQILEEHQLLLELAKHELPIVTPITLANGETLNQMTDEGIYYAAFTRLRARTVDEIIMPDAARVGRLLGRIHAISASLNCKHRLRLTPQSYGMNNLAYLKQSQSIPLEFENEYCDVVSKICELGENLFDGISEQWVHGDCHIGNLMSAGNDLEQQYYFVDFDDTIKAPKVQDIWLLLPGTDDHSKSLQQELISGYREFNDFEQQELRLVEVLRALRFIHFSTWLAKRWSDPAFPSAFPDFEYPSYWRVQIEDLKRQLVLIENIM